MVIGGRLGNLIGGPLVVAMFWLIPAAFLFGAGQENLVPSLAFCILFFAIGYLIAWWWVEYLLGVMYEHRAARVYPTQPWLWRSDWASGVVLSSPGTAARIGLFFALFGNFFVVLLVSLLLDGSKLSEKARAMVEVRYGISGTLVMLGLYLIVRAAQHWLTTRRFAHASVDLHSVPLREGADFPSQVTLPGEMQFDAPVQVSLKCVEIEHHNRGGKRRTVLLWEHCQEGAQHGSSLVFQGVKVPSGFPSSTVGEQVTDVSWRLSIAGKVAGREATLSFGLPVFGKFEVAGVSN